MNSSSATSASDPLSNRRWSIALLLAALIGLSSFGLASVPVWLVVVPLVLVGILDGEWGRRGDGETMRCGDVAKGVLSAVLFHGVVIATVVVAHHEVGKAGNGQLAAGGRYVMAKSDAGIPACSGCGGGKHGESLATLATGAAATKGGCCGGGENQNLAASGAGGGCGGGCGKGQSLATSATVRTAASGCGCGSGGKGSDAKAMMAGVANTVGGAPALRPPPVRSLNQIPGIDKPPGAQSRATANVRSLNPIPGNGKLESLPHSGTSAPPDARSEAAAVTKAPLRLPLPPTMAGKMAAPSPNSSAEKVIGGAANSPPPNAGSTDSKAGNNVRPVTVTPAAPAAGEGKR